MTDVSAVANRTTGKPAQAAGKVQGGEGKSEGGVAGAFATLFSLIGGGVEGQSPTGAGTATAPGKGEGVSFAALAAGMAAQQGDGSVVGVDGAIKGDGTGTEATAGEGEIVPGLTLPIATDGDEAATKIKLANQLHGEKIAKAKAEEAMAQVEDGKSGKAAKSAEDAAATLAKADETAIEEGKAASKGDAKAEQSADNASALAILAAALQQDPSAAAANAATPATGETKTTGKDAVLTKVGDAVGGDASQALAQQMQADASGGEGNASGQDRGDRSGQLDGLALNGGTGEATDAKMPTSPFQTIVDALPPGIQAQLTGTPATPAIDAPAATVQASSNADALNDQVIDMGVSGQWIDRMAREISALADGTGHSRFQLNPPNLGRIQVDLWQGESGTNLRLMTETDEATRRLREGQSALEANARVASLSLGSVTVEKASAPFESRDQNSNSNARQQQTDLGGQAQQQSGNQAQGDTPFARGQLNRSGFSTVMGGGNQQAEPAAAVPSTGTDGRRVRFA